MVCLLKQAKTKRKNQEIKKSRNLDLSQKTISGTKRTIIIDDDIWFKVGEEHFQTKKSIQTIVNVALTEYFTKD